MKPIRFSKTLFWLGLLTCLGGLNGLTGAEEPPPIIRELDFNDCDPVKLQGPVMSVDLGNKTLTVAEKQIRLLDVGSGSQRLRTALMNIGGQSEKWESFKAGQLVRVEGFEHPDGFVAAAIIQKIRTFQEDRRGIPSGLKQNKGNR